MNVTRNNKRMLTFLYVMIVLFSFTSIFSLLSVKIDIPIIKIWKEILIIMSYLLCVFFLFSQKLVSKKVFILSVIIPIYVIFIYLITSVGDNRVLVFYQLKLDFIPFLFPLALICLIKNSEQAFSIYNKICSILIGIGIINVVFIFIERVFTSWFLVFLAIDDMNNSSRASGLRLDNTSNGLSYGLRAMGTMTSYINSGTLMVICILILMESGFFKKRSKIILFPLFVAAAVTTTYKTAMVFFAFYIPIKLVMLVVKGNVNKKLILLIYTVISFIIMAICFNSMFLYNRIHSPALKMAAYNSIYLRVVQHKDILNDVEKQSLLTGVGIGVNGTQGPPEIKSRYSSKALDSTYVNVLSNYGLLGVTIYIFVFLFIFVKGIFWGGIGDFVTCFIIYFHLGIEFFANNMLMNFPLNVYLSIFLTLTLLYRKTSDRIL